jgi:hypothetical protein
MFCHEWASNIFPSLYFVLSVRPGKKAIFDASTSMIHPFLLLYTFLSVHVHAFILATPKSLLLNLHEPSRASPVESPLPSSAPFLELKDKLLPMSTCGFKTGDPNQPRTADEGFDCRVDTQNGLWGFCPTSVMAASDCGLAGNCVDSHACASGCGIFGNSKITTFTWYVPLRKYICDWTCQLIHHPQLGAGSWFLFNSHFDSRT